MQGKWGHDRSWGWSRRDEVFRITLHNRIFLVCRWVDTATEKSRKDIAPLATLVLRAPWLLGAASVRLSQAGEKKGSCNLQIVEYQRFFWSITAILIRFTGRNLGFKSMVDKGR
jgi:hypothetical protein